MSDLEQTFYIFSIVYMSIMLIVVAITVAYIVTIRNKVVRLEKNVSDKLHIITRLPETIVDLATAVIDRKSK